MKTPIARRDFLKVGAGSLAAASLARLAPAEPAAAERGAATEFQIACMTLPYAQFPLERALTGIQQAGYRFVAWGTTHREENGETRPVLAPDDPPEKARRLAARCRDL